MLQRPGAADGGHVFSIYKDKIAPLTLRNFPKSLTPPFLRRIISKHNPQPCPASCRSGQGERGLILTPPFPLHYSQKVKPINGAKTPAPRPSQTVSLIRNQSTVGTKRNIPAQHIATFQPSVMRSGCTTGQAAPPRRPLPPRLCQNRSKN
jgi:hypothetical protein